jgi:hypothetical protein
MPLTGLPLWVVRTTGLVEGVHPGTGHHVDVRKITLVIALMVGLAVIFSGAATASATTTCTDAGFRNRETTSVHRLSLALSYIQLESYRTAEAWALRAWQSFKAEPLPCSASYQRHRQDMIYASANILYTTRALRSGNLSAASRYSQMAQTWTARAGAEEARW